ncbi:MAG: malate dehydrogenase [bacterium]|nr:malate dehydrogenase [bacterium]
MLNRIGIIGGGNIGGVIVQEIVKRRLSRSIGLVDVKPPDMAMGKCLDIAEGIPVINADITINGSKSYEVIRDAQIVINTAGVPRTVRPDGSIPTREELLSKNLQITDTVAEAICSYCPDAIVISVANPLDAIVFRLFQRLNIPKNRLIGMAGVLDSARYRYFVAEAAGVSVENVSAMVLGGHGNTMVPVRSCCQIAGIPVEELLPGDLLDRIEERVRNAGAEVVGLMGTGSAFVSPAWSAVEMIESIVFDKKKILPCCVLLESEYGVNGYFVGVPVILGANGVEKIIEIRLTGAEKQAFDRSVDAVKKTVEEVKKAISC